MELDLQIIVASYSEKLTLMFNVLLKLLFNKIHKRKQINNTVKNLNDLLVSVHFFAHALSPP